MLPVAFCRMKLFAEPTSGNRNGCKHSQTESVFRLRNVKRTGRFENRVCQDGRAEECGVERRPKAVPPRQEKDHRKERDERHMLAENRGQQPAGAPGRQHTNSCRRERYYVIWFFPHLLDRSSCSSKSSHQKSLRESRFRQLTFWAGGR